MAAKRVKTTTVKEELPEELVPEVDMSGDMSNISFILQQFNESALRIEVYKDESGHMEYCETIRGTNQIDKDSIRDTWGGGKFELKIFENDSLENTITFRVAKKSLAIPQNNGSIESGLLREQNSFFQRMVLTLLSNKSEGPTFKDMVEMITKLNNPASPEKTLEVLLKGMELGKSGGGASPDWKSELIHTIKDLGQTVLPSVVEIAAASQRQAQPNGNGHMQIPVTSETVIKQAITEMKKKVIAGLPVGLALDWIVSNAGEYQHLLKALLEAGYERFEALDADLKNEPFKSWFTNLHEGLKNIYAGNSSDTHDDDSDRTARDVGNATRDGRTG